VKRVLTIAGSDSGGGAGTQADLRTFCRLGAYGMAVVTAVTAQNTLGVQGVYGIPADAVALQLEAVLSDLGADAVKTGMLYSAEIVGVVAEKLREHRIPRVVVDPVMAAESGTRLLSEKGVEAMRELLLPVATVVTPNLAEAGALTGERVETLSEMRRAAGRIHEMGAEWVVIKGGHLREEPIDLVYGGTGYVELEGERVLGTSVHGTGCTFSAALTVGMARGMTVAEAVLIAKRFVARSLATPLRLGKGRPIANQFVDTGLEMED
jgi:hydroxymethylpyrimidine/phosphomethylpyrimidine kinase